MFSYVGFSYSTTLDALTGHVIRTTYGFMAGIIGLFLSSLCVIKVVCIPPYLLLFWVLTVFAETRIRAFPADRCKAWRQGICLRQIFIAFFHHVELLLFICTYRVVFHPCLGGLKRHGIIFPSSGSFTYSYMLHISVTFRIWHSSRVKG